MSRLLLLLALCSIGSYSYACNACGCGAAGSTNLGVLPLSDKHFVGLRNYYRSSNTHDESAPQNDSKEYYNTTDLVIRSYPIKYIQLVAIVPYQYIRQSGGHNAKVYGLGDISVLANYQVLGKKPIGSWINSLWIGGGVELPTGRYNIIQNRNTLSPYLQPGSGTYDWVINSIYALKYMNWGWNTNVVYKINQENSNTHYQFGNNLTIGSNVYYRIEKKQIIYLPNVFLGYQQDQKDKNYNAIEQQSGGETWSLGAGVELFIQKWNIGFNISEPISDTHAQNIVKSNTRFLLTTIFNF